MYINLNREYISQAELVCSVDELIEIFSSQNTLTITEDKYLFEALKRLVVDYGKPWFRYNSHEIAIFKLEYIMLEEKK